MGKIDGREAEAGMGNEEGRKGRINERGGTAWCEIRDE